MSSKMASTLPRPTEKGKIQAELRRKASDSALLQTVRGKLQKQRSRLNDQINRELRMRTGAENLFRATNNKKLRETVALELSFVNSNLQLLKEELADLNGSLETYQSDGPAQSVPMIPLGLKETKDVELTAPFKDFILEHYSEDPEKYGDAITDFLDMRSAIRTPQRSDRGIQLLFEYYNQLYFVEKRFFPPNRNIGIHLQWYDSLTGIPNSQRSVGFEKGSILYNAAALYTQIAAKQDRSCSEGINAAIVNYQKAAGALLQLHDNFSHAPSMDMQSDTLDMLAQLMLSQAQECVFEKRVLGGVKGGVRDYTEVAQEAAMVCEMYQQTHRLMCVEKIKQYLPYSWVSMVQVKSQHYGALSHYYCAIGILQVNDVDDADIMSKLYPGLHAHMNNVSFESFPSKNEDQLMLVKGHLREALVQHEEAMHAHSYCKQLRKIDTFQEVLRYAHDRSLEKFSDLEEEDDFSELIKVPAIKAKSQQVLEAIVPDFGKYKVQDLFYQLGPVSVFSAQHSWSAPRTVEMVKSREQGFGFSVRGGSPVIIADVDNGGIAQREGMKVGDFIVDVMGTDVKWSSHEEVVSHIRASGAKLVMKLVTPMDRNFLQRNSQTGDENQKVMMRTPEGTIADKEKPEKRRSRLSWVFKKKDSEKEKNRNRKITM
ncbi:rhophilin-2-B-like [Lineus longissimus]|uniref:rhophilin-2-B-like n=1 Tax=Lineus longissimus TaxID=88925 RepID=UPI002B4C7AF9